MPKKTGSSNFPRAIGDSINEMIYTYERISSQIKKE